MLSGRVEAEWGDLECIDSSASWRTSLSVTTCCGLLDALDYISWMGLCSDSTVLTKGSDEFSAWLQTHLKILRHGSLVSQAQLQISYTMTLMTV